MRIGRHKRTGGDAVIYEGVVVTMNQAGMAHVTPLGMRFEGNYTLLAPFRPSTTLDNLMTTGTATMNFIDDVRVIAGSLTGRRDFELVATTDFPVPRLACALTTDYLRVERVVEDDLRPTFFMTVDRTQVAAPFRGFNRAQAAVVEAAILYSRVHMLSPGKIERELAVHAIAVAKTAGERELEAWDWLVAGFAEHGIVVGAEVEAST